MMEVVLHMFCHQRTFSERIISLGRRCRHNLMCERPIMFERGVTPNLVEVGHSKNRIFAF